MSNGLLRNALGTLLAGALIVVILCVASFGVARVEDQADDFSDRMASYRGTPNNRSNDDFSDPSMNGDQQRIADVDHSSNTRSNLRIAANPNAQQTGRQGNRTTSPGMNVNVPAPQESTRSESQENLPPLPPVDRIASGRIDRLESRLDRVLDGVLNQSRSGVRSHEPFDSRTHDQITELRIQNQVELRDLQRRMKLLAEQQDRMTSSMQSQRVDMQKTLAATDLSLTKHIDRLVNSIPQRSITYPVSHFGQAGYPNASHFSNMGNPAGCTNRLCPHCQGRQPIDPPAVPLPKNAGSIEDDLRSADRDWMKPVSADQKLGAWGTSQERENALRRRRLEAIQRSVPSPEAVQFDEPVRREKPIQRVPARPVPDPPKERAEQTPIESPEPRIAVDPAQLKTSLVVPTIESPGHQTIVSSTEQIIQPPSIQRSATDSVAGASTHIPRLSLPALKEPVPAPPVEDEFRMDAPVQMIAPAELASTNDTPSITLGSFVEQSPEQAAAPILPGILEEIPPFQNQLVENSQTETATSIDSDARLITQPNSTESPLKIRMSVIHVMADDVEKTLPAGIRTLEEFVTQQGGWSDGNHDAKAAQLAASLATTRTAQFMTSAETVFTNNEARFAIGSKCIHCVHKQGIMTLDRLVVRRKRETPHGTELVIRGQAMSGKAIATLPSSVKVVNAGDHFVITEAAQNGFIPVHHATKLSRLPLFGKKADKPKVKHLVIQRVILLTVSHADADRQPRVSIAEDSADPQIFNIDSRAEPGRLGIAEAPQPFLRAPR